MIYICPGKLLYLLCALPGDMTNRWVIGHTAVLSAPAMDIFCRKNTVRIPGIKKQRNFNPFRLSTKSYWVATNITIVYAYAGRNQPWPCIV